MVDPAHARAQVERLFERARLAGDVLFEGHVARQLDRLPRPTWQEEAAEAFADADRVARRRGLR